MRTIRAEWTKLRTLPGNAWAVLGMLGLTVGAGAAVCARTMRAEDAISGVYVGQNAVVVFAVLAVTNEYATGMIQTTVAATPQRGRLLAARLLVVAGTVVVAGALGVLGSVLTAARLLGVPPTSLGHRVVLGTVVYLVLLALLSAGVGLALRDTAAATGVVLGALYVLPIIAAQVPDADLRKLLQRLAPMTAITHPWPGLAIFCGYAAAALLIGAFSFGARDV